MKESYQRTPASYVLRICETLSKFISLRKHFYSHRYETSRGVVTSLELPVKDDSELTER